MGFSSTWQPARFANLRTLKLVAKYWVFFHLQPARFANLRTLRLVAKYLVFFHMAACKVCKFANLEADG